jgi:hypothetical protein
MSVPLGIRRAWPVSHSDFRLSKYAAHFVLL